MQLTNPKHRILQEEIFAPVVGLYVYPDAKLEETLRECNQNATYALTGAVFARNRKAVSHCRAGQRAHPPRGALGQ